jgi:hypothetical protein
MDMPESKVHSFIVKLWQDEAGNDETEKPVWHGYITHVPDGERRYLKRLRDIADFIARFLEDGSFERERRSRLKSWLRRLNSSLMRRL